MSHAEQDKASRLEDCGQSGVCELSPGCVRHFIERNAELAKERDEARAELERAIIDRNHAERRAREYLLAEPPEIVAARREGAEAMREAVAQLFDGHPDTPGLASMPLWAAEIRALPLPGEEKP